jgi:membrane protein implicated in regulation of membrane protease activity
MAELTAFYAAHPLWIWAALAAALLAVEIVAGSGWLLWPAAAAGVMAVLAGVWNPSLPLAVLIYAVLTIASTLLARRYLPRSVTHDGDDINDSEARLLGREARVVAPFHDRAGRVFIDGKEWAAELEGDAALAAGARVEVTGIAGARLKVRAA